MIRIMIPYQLQNWRSVLVTESLLRKLLQPTLTFFNIVSLLLPPQLRNSSLCRALTTLKSLVDEATRKCCSKQPSASPVPQVSTFKDERVYTRQRKKKENRKDLTRGSTGPVWISVRMRREKKKEKKNGWVTTTTSSDGKEKVSTENVCWLQGTAVNSGCRGGDCRKRPRQPGCCLRAPSSKRWEGRCLRRHFGQLGASLASRRAVLMPFP